MKLREVTRTAGTATLHIWPPSVLTGSGPTFIRAGEGVLKSVRRLANRLSVTIEHQGREAIGSVEVDADQVPSLDAVERLLMANLGKTVSAIGDLEV